MQRNFLEPPWAAPVDYRAAGHFLSEMREAMDLCLEGLAIRACQSASPERIPHITAPYVASVEHGRIVPPESDLHAFESALGLSSGDLLNVFGYRVMPNGQWMNIEGIAAKLTVRQPSPMTTQQ